ncbi:MAG: aminotransferase class I/II-fold pyridoxal phosphate-dependent enzyme [Planctomycetota bacterium]|nr:aminotransferase class I/II-fold pyridoxal phosphate-dependent enzyme [Planctomycetota bacterium]
MLPVDVEISLLSEYTYSKVANNLILSPLLPVEASASTGIFMYGHGQQRALAGPELAGINYPVDMANPRHLSDRVSSIDVSGIRRAFQLGADLENPINLSIGQPDFPVPGVMKEAAIDAIQSDLNGYTLTTGHPPLLKAISTHLEKDINWNCGSDDLDLMITSGTSGALLLSFMAMLNPGDEVVIADPYFVVYPTLGPMTGSSIVYCDTYPDFRMTAERVESCLTDRTKLVLVNSPANPTGVILNDEELKDLVDLCSSRDILLVSDEIYDLFTYPEHLDSGGRCPSPARHTKDMLLIRGFGKNYGCTGWRLGYAAGPSWLIAEMAKLQQYTFVCAPSMAQAGATRSFEIDMGPEIGEYHARSMMIHEALGDITTVSSTAGAFYAFIEVPGKLGCSATEFCERAIEHNLILIPGAVFSQRDTHVRISYACERTKLAQGLDILRDMMS